MKWFTEGGDVPGGRRLLRSATRVFCPEAGGLCLAGGLLRARSKAISFCLKAVRAGPAVAPALHPRYPANTTARCAGALSKSVFLTDQARFAPGSARLLAASLRLALENAFPSAFVMPLKVKTQFKTKVIKNKSLNKRQKRFNFLASGFRFQVSGFWVVGCGLWVVGCGLWVVGCEL